jgi:hypothetical protein
MNIFKKIDNKVSKFFEKSMIYNKKEGIIFLIIFFILILLPLFLGVLLYTPLAKISMIYMIISIIFILILIDTEYYNCQYFIIIYLLPYIFLMMFLDSIFLKFIPYRGDDPLIMRYYKIRTLKRKAYINKLKFWK